MYKNTYNKRSQYLYNLYNLNNTIYKEFKQNRKYNYFEKNKNYYCNNKIIRRYYTNNIQPPEKNDENWLFIIILAGSVYITHKYIK